MWSPPRRSGSRSWNAVCRRIRRTPPARLHRMRRGRRDRRRNARHGAIRRASRASNQVSRPPRGPWSMIPIRTVVIEPGRCEQCASPLVDAIESGRERRQVVDVRPVPSPEVTEYQRVSKTCRCCGTVTTPDAQHRQAAQHRRPRRVVRDGRQRQPGRRHRDHHPQKLRKRTRNSRIANNERYVRVSVLVTTARSCWLTRRPATVRGTRFGCSPWCSRCHGTTTTAGKH